jgi:hypothetical protein
MNGKPFSYDMIYGGGTITQQLNEMKVHLAAHTNQEQSNKNYLEQSFSQLFMGRYSEDVTWLGTGMQLGTGLIGVDLPADIRDLNYDLSNWEWSWGHAGNTTIDAIGVLPFVGALKNADEVMDLIKGIVKVAFKSNYRKLFLDKNPRLPKGWQVHHTLPQKYEEIMKKAGVNIHEAEYLRGVDPKVHSKITNEWTK